MLVTLNVTLTLPDAHFSLIASSPFCLENELVWGAGKARTEQAAERTVKVIAVWKIILGRECSLLSS